MIDLLVGKDTLEGKYFFSTIKRDSEGGIVKTGPNVMVADLSALTCVIKNKIIGNPWSLTSDLHEISDQKSLDRSELEKLMDGIAS